MSKTKTVAGGSHEFTFDINARVTQKSDHDLLSALEDYAKVVGYRYFQTREFNKWADRRCHSGTIIERFGSWKKALSIIGVEGGHKGEYTVEELISNLEAVWKEVGRPPGHRQISKMGARISNHPYKRIWGSVRKACISISRFHRGEITRAQLLEGNTDIPQRRSLPLDVRWQVLKRDNYCCVVCGANPAAHHSVELHIDHIVPVIRGGTNDLSNLRTLCDQCNIGKGGE
ncbi:MAG: HNH endonuclease [Rectinemataceae bacterium]|nr:HNH endonuclease [Rectinemataceae bacterium]